MAARFSDVIVTTVAHVNTKWRTCHVDVTSTLRLVSADRMYECNMRVGQTAVSNSVLTCDVEWKFLASIVPADVTSIYGTASSDARLRCLRFRGANQHPVTENTHNLRLVTVLASNKERNSPTDRPTERTASYT
jgi:hypothetical protein